MDIRSLLLDSTTPTGSPKPPPPDADVPKMPAPRTVPSPAHTVGKLPTPPLATDRSSKPKRNRNDPKPIWAVREHEHTQEPPRKEPPRRVPQAPPPRPPLQQRIITNGARSSGSRILQGFERPITDAKHIYDEISRKVCDLIWRNVVDNDLLQQATHEAPGVNIEIEAKWGQIIDIDTKKRLTGIHLTECLINPNVRHRFESTMSTQQHMTMNKFLNAHVGASQNPESHRTPIEYKHLREVDTFYELDQESYMAFHPAVQQFITNAGSRPPRIRVTRDMKTNEVTAKIIKVRVENMSISSPLTEWDYRVSINLEVEYPGPIDNLTLAVEQGKTPEQMARKKDRMSYRWLDGAYALDLTQVHTGNVRNHELELELDSKKLLSMAGALQQGQASEYEQMIAGMINNLRVLSREMSGSPPALG